MDQNLLGPSNVIIGLGGPPTGFNRFWHELLTRWHHLKPMYRVIVLTAGVGLIVIFIGLAAFLIYDDQTTPAGLKESNKAAPSGGSQPQGDGAAGTGAAGEQQAQNEEDKKAQAGNGSSGSSGNGSGSSGGSSSGGSSSGGGAAGSSWPGPNNTGRLASGCTSFDTVSSPTGYFNIGDDYDDQPFVDKQPDGTWVIDCIITDSTFLVYHPKTTFQGVEISASPGENAAIQFRFEGPGGAHSGKVLYSTIHAVSPSQQLQYAILDMSSYGLHLKGNNFYWWSDAVQLGGNDILIEDNWMHDPVYYTNDHTDAIQHFGGGQNVTIRHNKLTLDLTYMAGNGNQTAALALFQDGSAGQNSYNNVLVDNNLVGGGGYSFYCGYEKVKDPISNVRFTNNKVLASIWPNGGYWGPKAAEPTWGQSGNQWTDNTWFDGPNAGQTIPE